MFRLGCLLRNNAIISNCINNSALVVQEIKITAEELWRSVTSVSNAGKKRGRGKGQDKRGRINLNAGQKIGFGKENVLWPGLNIPLVQSNTVVNIQKLPPLETPAQSNNKLTKKSRNLHPLERGWSGRFIEGRDLGPPDPDGDVTFDDFSSIIVQCKILLPMTSLFGKKRKASAIVLTGNGKGLIGMGKCTALDMNVAIKRAKNKAIKRLLTFNFTNNYSVNHDFFCQFGKLKMFVYQKPDGYGLTCQRVLKACCKLIGIKNIYIKIEGNTSNTLHIIKAFLIGLKQQKTHQDIADQSNLHLVEFLPNRYMVPKVLASPQNPLTPDEAQAAATSYEDVIWKGKTVLKRTRDYQKLFNSEGYQKYLKKADFRRNRYQSQIGLMTEYGSLMSHLTEKYPDCVNMGKKKNNEETSEYE